MNGYLELCVQGVFTVTFIKVSEHNRVQYVYKKSVSHTCTATMLCGDLPPPATYAI